MVAHPDTFSHADMLRAAFTWWDAAGVDVLVDDAPFGWLNRAPAERHDAAVATAQTGEAGPAPRSQAAPAAPSRAAPQDLSDVIRQLLSDEDLIEAGPPTRRIAASGDPCAPLMILIDQPDEGDAARGALLTGESGLLLDKMLAALGRSRADCYFAALCPGVPAGGLLPRDAVARYAPLARAHIGFAGSDMVWLLGGAVIRAIMEADALPLPQGLQLFNQGGGKKPMVAGHAPRFLLQQPRYKAQMWSAMQTLRIGMTA
jgi:uracil-DNA glycosylase family 4